MWDHCNAALYNARLNTLSRKQRDTIMEQVDFELQVGPNGMREKDASTICFDQDKVKKWDTQSLETWLKHVRKTCQQSATQHLKRQFDSDSMDLDEVYMEWHKRLKQTLLPQFSAWRMKHHYETLDMYLQSIKEFKKEMKNFLEQIIE